MLIGLCNEEMKVEMGLRKKVERARGMEKEGMMKKVKPRELLEEQKVSS